jgi:hypothetical protein
MLLVSSLFAAGCSTVSGLTDKVSDVHLWPFGDSKSKDRSYKPENASEYQCASNKKFFLRTLENGDSVWLILPEREVALAKTSKDSTKRYTNGITTLTLADETTLEINPTTSYTACKLALVKTK